METSEIEERTETGKHQLVFVMTEGVCDNGSISLKN